MRHYEYRVVHLAAEKAENLRPIQMPTVLILCAKSPPNPSKRLDARNPTMKTAATNEVLLRRLMLSYVIHHAYIPDMLMIEIASAT